MKIILGGSSGLIGERVFRRCLYHPSISAVVILSCHPLPHLSFNNKITITVISPGSFSTYADAFVEEIRGAEACIWSAGSSEIEPLELELATISETEGKTSAAAKLAIMLSARVEASMRCKFVFCSGRSAEQDQERLECSLGNIDLSKELMDDTLADLMEAKRRSLEVVIIRTNTIISNGFHWGLGSIKADDLATVMVENAVYGRPRESVHVVTSQDVNRRGKALRREMELIKLDVARLSCKII